MAEADKPEVPGATGDDSPHLQPAEPPGEPRREPHPPETEKQPPQLSTSSNGVKMYCLYLLGPGRGRGREVSLGGPGPGWASAGGNRPRAAGEGRSRCSWAAPGPTCLARAGAPHRHL